MSEFARLNIPISNVYEHQIKYSIYPYFTQLMSWNLHHLYFFVQLCLCQMFKIIFCLEVNGAGYDLIKNAQKHCPSFSLCLNITFNIAMNVQSIRWKLSKSKVLGTNLISTSVSSSDFWGLFSNANSIRVFEWKRLIFFFILSYSSQTNSPLLCI